MLYNIGDMELSSDLRPLEASIGHSFGRRELLLQALTHSSYANENRGQGHSDNECLEFLGDAVIDLVVGHRLMTLYPDASEGTLSVARSRVVSSEGLSKAARDLQLGEWLRLGKGEHASGGREKS